MCWRPRLKTIIVKEPDFKVVRLSGGKYFKNSFVLNSTMAFYWPEIGRVIVIPAGTVTNFASVPFGFKNLFPVNCRHRLPAVIHDYLYGMGGYISVELSVRGITTPVVYTRKQADKLFYEAMLEERVTRVKAWCMYTAVRCFGFGFWEKIRRK